MIKNIYAGSATGTKQVEKVYAADPNGESVLIWEKEPEPAHIYGAEWDGTATTTWLRTDGAALFAEPSPAVNNGNGSSPFDTLMPWAGMVREERMGGTMVKIPKYWYKWTRDGVKMKLRIADYAASGFYVSPAHADRGDGVGERDYVYVGAYHCASDYKSKTGVLPNYNITKATARSGIHNLGSSIWQYDYAMFWTIAMLYLVEYADWNANDKIGYGNGTGTAQTTPPFTMGSTDGMQYHTGTSAATRTTRGACRYRYIEGLWDNLFDFIDGAYGDNSGKMYCIKNPADFSDSTGGTLVTSDLIKSKGSGITAWTTPSATGFEYALFPSALGGAESTYVSDIQNEYGGFYIFAMGGYNYYTSLHGLFHNYFFATNQTGGAFGCRIMELP